jgi:hypothetical protein
MSLARTSHSSHTRPAAAAATAAAAAAAAATAACARAVWCGHGAPRSSQIAAKAPSGRRPRPHIHRVLGSTAGVSEEIRGPDFRWSASLNRHKT